MIRNDQELQFVREQLGRVESAFQDLEEQVRPQSEEQFQLMAQAYVVQIEKLRRDIDEYCAGRGETTVNARRNRPTAKRRSA